MSVASREAGVLNPLEDDAECHAKTLPPVMQRRQTLHGLDSQAVARLFSRTLERWSLGSVGAGMGASHTLMGS